MRRIFSNKSLFRNLLFIWISVTLNGCIAAEFIALEDIAVLEEGEAVSVGGASEIAITDEAVAMSRLARVRIMPRTFGNPLLYTEESGIQRGFAELLDESTIRSVKSGRVLTLPFRVFKVGRFASAELRTGPSLGYKVFKTIPSDRLVFVTDEYPGWYKVEYKNIMGWVAAGTLVSGMGTNSKKSNVTYKKIECDHCEGEGSIPCFFCKETGGESCPSCKGNGSHKCLHCKGTGRNVCLICKGKGPSDCPSCRGQGFVDCGVCHARGYFDCDLCHSTGKITCRACHGTNHMKCYYCFGSKTILHKVD